MACDICQQLCIEKKKKKKKNSPLPQSAEGRGRALLTSGPLGLHSSLKRSPKIPDLPGACVLSGPPCAAAPAPARVLFSKVVISPRPSPQFLLRVLGALSHSAACDFSPPGPPHGCGAGAACKGSRAPHRLPWRPLTVPI